VGCGRSSADGCAANLHRTGWNYSEYSTGAEPVHAGHSGGLYDDSEWLATVSRHSDSDTETDRNTEAFDKLEYVGDASRHACDGETDTGTGSTFPNTGEITNGEQTVGRCRRFAQPCPITHRSRRPRSWTLPLSACSAISALEIRIYLGTSTVFKISEITASVVAPSSSASARRARR
jgi:hypothetical protein